MPAQSNGLVKLVRLIGCPLILNLPEDKKKLSLLVRSQAARSHLRQVCDFKVAFHFLRSHKQRKKESESEREKADALMRRACGKERDSSNRQQRRQIKGSLSFVCVSLSLSLSVRLAHPPTSDTQQAEEEAAKANVAGATRDLHCCCRLCVVRSRWLIT